MSRPPQEHLSTVVEANGTGSGTKAIVELVERGLAELNRASQEARVAKRGHDQKLNPSVTDAGKCVRKVYLSLRNVPETEPLTTDSLVNFGVGHAVEEWLADVLEAQGGTVLREVRVEIPAGETIVSGYADFLVAMPDFNALIELKSINSRAMGFMLRNKEAGKEDHRRQLGLYLHAANHGLLRRPHDFSGPRGTCVGCGLLRRGGERQVHGNPVVSEHRANGFGDTRGASAIPGGSRGIGEGERAVRAVQQGDASAADVVLSGEQTRNGAGDSGDVVAVPESSEAGRRHEGAGDQTKAQANNVSAGAQVHPGEHAPVQGGASRVSSVRGREDEAEEGCRLAAHHGYLIYVVKDPTKGEPNIHAFAVEYDQVKAEADLLSLSQLKLRADREMDPGIPVGYVKSKYPCSYCGFKSLCHG